MTNSPPDPPKMAWISRVWTKAQPILIRESIVILQSVIKGGEILLGRLETRSGQLQLAAPAPESSYLLKAQPWFQALGRKWWQLMTGLRAKLPQAWQEKLTETGLTAIFIGILLIFLWPGPTQAPAAPPAPKARPTPTLTPPPAQTTVLVKPRPAPNPSPSVLPGPPELEPTPDSPRPEPAAAELPPPVNSPAPEKESTIDILEEPTAISDLTELDELEKTEPEMIAPPAIPPLSPQERALTDARNQLLDITDRYWPGLVENLTLDPEKGTAKFTLTLAWSDLSASQQDGLAQELWQRSQQLEFSQLLMTDPSGQVLVRPPIIGAKPIIVHRKATVP